MKVSTGSSEPYCGHLLILHSLIFLHNGFNISLYFTINIPLITHYLSQCRFQCGSLYSGSHA